MAKVRETYVCGACGARTPQWRGQCPACREWNTLALATLPRVTGGGSARTSLPGQTAPVPLGSVSEEGHEPFGTGLE
ncbi:MAG: DNA repair protein RadA, partial [Desulfovibrionaceae bacterium]|nr:DNA repair protein RadA [Desulfovibrionaceae bacterium]